MSIYQLHREQLLNTDLQTAWEYISTPLNLKEITPPGMGFEVLNKNLPDTMYEGMIILYKVKPLAGIPMKWMTEITQVKEGEYFVDEQRSGPYRIWHHEHFLEKIEKGVLMTDIVTYKPPFSFLGDLVHPLLIGPALTRIFDYRFLRMEELFNEKTKK